MALRLYTRFVALSTAVLIFAGGLVTSTGSGLSVPDWPNTYGQFMFTFPLDKMVGGIRFEHSHRLIASTVGFLILVLAVWLWRAEPRAWVRRLGYLALAAVITQGILGGITVLWYLPEPISIAHASLAQIVFCLTTAIALVTSRGWTRSTAALPSDDGVLRTAHHCHDRLDLRSDPHRRDDAAHRRRTGHPGLPSRLRSPHSAALGSEDRHPLSRIVSARSWPQS